MLTRIQNGHRIDPALGVDRVGDVWIKDGKIVPSCEVQTGSANNPRTLDASDCIVMAGGIDLHTHIGGGKLTLARLLLEEPAKPSRDLLPTAPVVAQRYLDMGYTTCFEPAVIPCNARSAHAEMAEIRGIDTGGFCLLGNDDLLMQLLADNAPQSVINDYVAWMVMATQCIAVKVVNPGGISAFKFNQRRLDVDTPHPRYGVTPSTIVRRLCRAVSEIGLAHPLHVHCSNLGVPGNIESTLKTIDAADGFPIHLAHAQFHCYGNNGPYAMTSAAAKLVDAIDRNPHVTIDVGQVMFGQTVTISADSMHQFHNIRYANPRKSILVDVECEAGCGVVPFRYRRRQFVHSLQWAIGLELFLMIDDPARVFLTTDHPNGAPFTTYPHLIRLLCDRAFRETALAEIDPEAAAASSLAGIDREYTLGEIAIMTRSAPAAILGLSGIGDLAIGSSADVVVYEKNRNFETMFAQPKFVLKNGVLVRGKGSVSTEPSGSITHTANVEFNPKTIATLANRYESFSAMAMSRLQISDDEMQASLGTVPVKHASQTKHRAFH
ncbi:Formyltransferase/hydrolase complex Fhc subunit A [Novipirellula aureliae]|uniref:Formyltransferase/hydrolase complex Fhc subunit A n=1 Tax=Novipirellula aureliae TaxID=2527966 RepID=A0A5C6E5I5_9BACT|nr:formylmethanofuran dehydrogenase subunit A [Novipirellula aureliae]TWU44963.1 Formyltransferase/hydrolase complex Fhc subunit A [Novipirellula aureliae]